MGSQWANRGSDWYEQALIYAGLGFSEAAIAYNLAQEFPAESAATLGAAAATAVRQHQQAATFMGTGGGAPIGPAAGESPVAVPQVPIQVDVTFTFIHPGTGKSRHGFIRVDLPPGATMADVEEEVQDFMDDMVAQYGDAYAPVFGDVSVVGLIQSTP